MAGGPTPIILEGNNSPWHQLARGVSDRLSDWAEAYATQKLQEKVMAKAKDNPPEIPEDLKNQFGAIWTNQGWQIVQKQQTEADLLSQYGLVEIGGKAYRPMLVNGKTILEEATPTEEELPYKKGAYKEFKVGESIIGATYMGDKTQYDKDLPVGWKSTGTTAPRYKPETNVSVSVDTGKLTQSTQTELQGKVLEADTTLKALNQIGTLFKDEYLEYAGKGKAWLTKMADKMGSDWNEEFLKDYTEWKSLVDKEALAYRKEITGVAGGEYEMEQIVKTTINTQFDSPTTFKAKLALMEENTKIAKQRYQAALTQFNETDFSKLTDAQKAQIAKQNPFNFDITDYETQKQADDFLKMKGL